MESYPRLFRKHDFLDDDEVHQKCNDRVLIAISSSFEWYMSRPGEVNIGRFEKV